MCPKVSFNTAVFLILLLLAGRVPVNGHLSPTLPVAAYENHSCKRPASVTDIFIASRGCPLTRASTVLLIFEWNTFPGDWRWEGNPVFWRSNFSHNTFCHHRHFITCIPYLLLYISGYAIIIPYKNMNLDVDVNAVICYKFAVVSFFLWFRRVQEFSETELQYWSYLCRYIVRSGVRELCVGLH